MYGVLGNPNNAILAYFLRKQILEVLITVLEELINSKSNIAIAFVRSF